MKTLNQIPRIAAACGFAFALLFLLTPAALAQDSRQQPQQESEAAADGAADPASLLSRLNLTQEQVAQMREIRAQSVPQARELTRRLNQARRALDEAIYSDTLDESLVEQRAREVAEAQAALVRMRSQTELRVRRVLTPVQLQTFRELRLRARLRQRERRRLERGLPARRPDSPDERPLQRLRERRRGLNRP